MDQLDQPQSIGDLIGRAFRFYKQHVPMFLKVLLVPTIFSAVGVIGIQWGLPYVFSSAKNPTASSIQWAAIASGVVIFLLARWVLALRQLAFVRVSAGYAEDYLSGHAYMLKKKWSLVLLFLLCVLATIVTVGVWGTEIAISTYLASLGGLMPLFAAAGLLLGIAGLSLSLGFVYLVSFLVFSVLACEEAPLGQVIKRAVLLTLKDFWRSLAFGMLVFMTISLMATPLMLPVSCFVAFEVYRNALQSSALEAAKIPIHAMVLVNAWEQLTYMMLWPVIFLAYGFFYYDLRLRQEGVDIIRRLETIQEKA